MNPTFRRIRFLHYTFNGSISLNTSADRFAQLTILDISSLQKKSVASRVKKSSVSIVLQSEDEVVIGGVKAVPQCQNHSGLAPWHNDTVS